MITIEIPEANHFFYVPENLGECDSKEYLDICKLLYWLNFGFITEDDFKSVAVYILLGLPYNLEISKVVGFISEDDLSKWENVYRISEILESFFDRKVDEETGHVSLTVKQHFVHNHNPVFHFFGKYYGPEEGFANVLFGQYLDGLEEFIEFSQSGEIQNLRNLFAILYLPKKEKYCRKKSLKRAKGIFRYVDIRNLYGCFVFFNAFQNYMMSGEISVMGQAIDLEIIFKNIDPEKTKSSVPGLGWLTTAQDLAESGVFGAYDNVRNTELWPVILRLYELKKRAIDDKERENKSGSNKQNPI